MCSIETHFLSYKPDCFILRISPSPGRFSLLERNDDHILAQLPKIEKETHQSAT